MNYIVNRLKENSTYISGVILLAVVAKVGITIEQVDIWMTIIGALSVAGVAIPDSVAKL